MVLGKEKSRAGLGCGRVAEIRREEDVAGNRQREENICKLNENLQSEGTDHAFSLHGNDD